MKPTPGRIVLYREEGGGVLAAIVARVHSDTEIDLAAFMPQVLPVYFALIGGEPGAPAEGTWNWPVKS